MKQTVLEATQGRFNPKEILDRINSFDISELFSKYQTVVYGGSDGLRNYPGIPYIFHNKRICNLFSVGVPAIPVYFKLKPVWNSEKQEFAFVRNIRKRKAVIEIYNNQWILVGHVISFAGNRANILWRPVNYSPERNQIAFPFFQNQFIHFQDMEVMK